MWHLDVGPAPHPPPLLPATKAHTGFAEEAVSQTVAEEIKGAPERRAPVSEPVTKPRPKGPVARPGPLTPTRGQPASLPGRGFWSNLQLALGGGGFERR